MNTFNIIIYYVDHTSKLILKQCFYHWLIPRFMFKNCILCIVFTSILCFAVLDIFINKP